MGDAPGPDDLSENGRDDTEPTAGERLLYALGQLYRLWNGGELPVHPGVFAVEDLARVIGVSEQLELVTHDGKGWTYHFPGEVLLVRPEERFPWRLATVEEWAVAEDFGAFWRDLNS